MKSSPAPTAKFNRSIISGRALVIAFWRAAILWRSQKPGKIKPKASARISQWGASFGPKINTAKSGVNSINSSFSARYSLTFIAEPALNKLRSTCRRIPLKARRLLTGAKSPKNLTNRPFFLFPADKGVRRSRMSISVFCGRANRTTINTHPKTIVKIKSSITIVLNLYFAQAPD